MSENFGIAAAEAMLAGLPVVLGEGVAIARDVKAVEAGLVVVPEPLAIAQAIAELLDDEGRRRAMGQRGRTFAIREYSGEAMAKRLVALYGGLTAGGGCGRWR